MRKKKLQNIKVAVDVVVFTVAEDELRVILIQMKKNPLKGMWAFPGGLINQKESPGDAAKRELREKTGLGKVYLEQLYTFGEPKRDPLSRVVSVAYFALINNSGVKLKTTSKYADIKWVSVDKLPKLAYDHSNIAKYALQRLRWKLEYTNVAYSLLPKYFSLSDLRRAYEIILGRSLDRRNFQRKIFSLSILKKTSRKQTGKHRPANLYEFKNRNPMIVEVL